MSDRCQTNGNDFPPYIALTINTISKGRVKISVSSFMIKLDFWAWPPVENGSRAPDGNTFLFKHICVIWTRFVSLTISPVAFGNEIRRSAAVK